MAGITNEAFRLFVGVLVQPSIFRMISDKGLLYQNERTLKMISSP